MAKLIKKAARKPAKKSVRKSANKKITKAAPKKAKKASKKTGKRFLIIYHAPIEAILQTAKSSPEDMAKGMAMWEVWAKRVGDKLADLGGPLVNGKRLHSNGSSTPSTREVAGYSLLEAEDWAEVETLLTGHPHISGWHPGATIEVHEMMLIPGL